MKGIVVEAEKLQDEIVEYRRHLHRTPETDMSLPETVAYVRSRLESFGYTTATICGESGIVATVGGTRGGKTVLLRADMDALPVAEEADVPFKSTNGAMHACGHDMHTAMLLGAAKILKGVESELAGTVKLMFQPGEETLHGAKAMIEAGVLESPKVDVAMMMHVFSGFPIPSGMFGVSNPGPSSAASDWFDIEIQGKGGHGAMPNFGVDPLNVAAHLHIALQTIISREIPAVDSAVVTIGYLQGGATANVIPDTARMGGTVRTFSEENRNFIEKRINEISAGVAATFRAQVKVTYVRGCPAVVNDKAACESLRASIAEAFGNGAILKALPFGGKMMGSEDFSFVSQAVPSVMTMLTAGDATQGYVNSMHHPKVRFDESVLYKGAAAYANFAIEWLKASAIQGGSS